MTFVVRVINGWVPGYGRVPYPGGRTPYVPATYPTGADVHRRAIYRYSSVG